MVSSTVKEAHKIINKFKDQGMDILYTVRDDVIIIRFMESKPPREGQGRRLLEDLKDSGCMVDVEHPMVRAIGFWRRMYIENLIKTDPDSMQTFEDRYGPGAEVLS